MKNLLKEFKINLCKNGVYGTPVVNKNYEESELHQAFVVNAHSMGYEFSDDDRPFRILGSIFTSIAVYLSKTKITKADEAVAIVLTDIAGNFKFAGIVEYHENEENPEEPGNWSFVMTLDEQDLIDIEKEKSVKRESVSSDGFKSILNRVTNDYGISFEHQSYMYDSINILIDTIIQVLDREGDSGNMDIEIPGIVTLSVEVENDEKSFSITPDGVLKTIIKDDVELDDVKNYINI